MKSVVLMMTASGSAMILIFYVVCSLYGNRLKAKWKRYMLMLAEVYYLIPFSSAKYIVNGWLRRHRLPMLFPKKLTDGVMDKADIVYVIDGKARFEYTQPLLVWGTVICGIVSMIFLLYFIYTCWSFKKKIKAYKRREVSEKCRRVFERALHRQAIRRHVSLYKSPDVESPAATGVFKPCIWLPEGMDTLSESEMENVLVHELAHIKHHDLLMYIVGLMVITVHWFNPFSYLLLYFIRLTNEEYSDETAVEHMGQEERISYCSTLITLACENRKKSTLGLSFSRQPWKRIKKRIDFIMMKGRKNVLIAWIAGALGIIAGTVTVFAYDTPQYIVTEKENGEYQEGVEAFYAGTLEMEVEELPYDDFFADNSGNVYPVTEEQTSAECRHEYELGIRTKHILDGNGGCTVYYYHAKRCTACGIVVYGEMYDFVTRKVCPH